MKTMTSALPLRNSVSSVTNLAARLSGQARAGQIRIAPRAYAVVETQVQAECIGDLTLKGFHKPVTVLNVLGLTAAERQSRPSSTLLRTCCVMIQERPFRRHRSVVISAAHSPSG
jgi:hypothetical protein